MIFFQLSFLDSGFLVYLIFLCIENIWLVLFVQPIIWSKNFCFCALCWWCLMCESVLIDGLLFVSIFLFFPYWMGFWSISPHSYCPFINSWYEFEQAAGRIFVSFLLCFCSVQVWWIMLEIYDMPCTMTKTIIYFLTVQLLRKNFNFFLLILFSQKKYLCGKLKEGAKK